MSQVFPRLPYSADIVDDRGCPTQMFQIWWDQFATELETSINNIVTVQSQIFEALSSMPDISDVHIAADYTGTVDADTFPVIIQATRLSGSTDNTDDATWSFTVDSGSLTATVDTGILSITGITATSVVTITSVYNGVTKSRSFTVYLDIAPPPQTDPGGGGSSSSAYDTSISNVASATHAPVSDELSIVIGSSGTATLSAPLTVSTAATSPTGSYEVFGKWQWWNGSAWTDVATEIASDPDCNVTGIGPKVTGVNNGSLNVSQSKTGLTVGATEKFRLEARNHTGTRIMILSGTASAVSS